MNHNLKRDGNICTAFLSWILQIFTLMLEAKIKATLIKIQTYSIPILYVILSTHQLIYNNFF